MQMFKYYRGILIICDDAYDVLYNIHMAYHKQNYLTSIILTKNISPYAYVSHSNIHKKTK